MGGKLYCDVGSGKRGFFGESCAAAINEKRQMWEARKHGGLVVLGAGRGICIGSSRTPQIELGPRGCQATGETFLRCLPGRGSTPLCYLLGFVQLAMGCANPTFSSLLNKNVSELHYSTIVKPPWPIINSNFIIFNRDGGGHHE